MRDNKGFTLIEVLVAMVIISISLLALGAFTIQVLSSDNVAFQRAVATNVASRQMENWASTNTAPVNPTTVTLNGVAYTLVPSTNTTGLAVNGAPQARALTVSWVNKGITRTVVVTSMTLAP